MSESKPLIKIPTKDGLANAREKLKNMRRKEPSPDLIRIIDEVTQDEAPKKEDIAAYPRSPEAGI